MTQRGFHNRLDATDASDSIGIASPGLPSTTANGAKKLTALVRALARQQAKHLFKLAVQGQTTDYSHDASDRECER